MENLQYIEVKEPLFFFSRLDRYTPTTAKFIPYGQKETTLLTEEALSGYLSGQGVTNFSSQRNCLWDIGAQVPEDYESLRRADNNHSSYWNYGYVHGIEYPQNFWNLDGDLGEILEEVGSIDPDFLVGITKSIMPDLLADEGRFTEFLSNNGSLKLLYDIDDKRQDLPPFPDEDNWDSTAYEAFCDASMGILNEIEAKNVAGDLKDIIINYIATQDNDEAKRSINNINLGIIRKIVPKNDKVDGYIIDGYLTMEVYKAKKQAFFVGNICDVLERHMDNKGLLPDDIDPPPSLPIENFPTQMKPGMPSYWLGGVENPESTFRELGGGYFHLGMAWISAKGGRSKIESDMIIDPPDGDEFQKLRSKISAVIPENDL